MSRSPPPPPPPFRSHWFSGYNCVKHKTLSNITPDVAHGPESSLEIKMDPISCSYCVKFINALYCWRRKPCGQHAVTYSAFALRASRVRFPTWGPSPILPPISLPLRFLSVLIYPIAIKVKMPKINTKIYKCTLLIQKNPAKQLFLFFSYL